MGRGILEGIRILDFTRVLAGPHATRILGDFGAEVIKVQSEKAPEGREGGDRAYFSNWNRNKRSITLNMDLPEARELALKLASLCDAVIENFSPRVMSNWGLSYGEISKVRKDIIMVSMSAMGRTGPWKDFVAFGPTIQSLSGLTYLTSYDSDTPVGPGHSYVDTIAGLYCALAFLTALEYRERTGLGQFIDLSEYEASCTILGPGILDTMVNQRDVRPRGNSSYHVPAAPHGCYQCQGDDNWCVIAVFEEDEWMDLCKVMGDPAWAMSDRFSTMKNRRMNEAALDRHMEEWTIQYTPEEIVQRLQEANVPSAVVQNAEDLAGDPQLLARNFFREIKDPVSGSMPTDTCPIRFRSGEQGPWRPAPLPGEDNKYVYHELLGLSEDTINSYIEKGIIS